MGEFWEVLETVSSYLKQNPCKLCRAVWYELRVRFFRRIQDWIKSERIWKRILRFFTEQINTRSFGSWCVKGTQESTSRLDSSVSLTHQIRKILDWSVGGETRNSFRDFFGFRIQSWIFLKKRTLSSHKFKAHVIILDSQLKLVLEFHW